MKAITVSPNSPPEVLDVRMLARELANTYRDRVCRLKHELGLSTQEAAAKAVERPSLGHVWEKLERPAEVTTWSDIQELASYSPERALDRWEEVKQAAREELRSGERAARDVEVLTNNAYQRAQFLALREDLYQAWNPRNGIERQLIDMMAQAATAQAFWLLRAVERCLPDEPSVAMVDRFNRIFVRTLRALVDLRKAPISVLVQHAEQINVAQEQVNVAAGKS